MTTASVAQPLVGVRYVGRRPFKDDNLLGRRGRRWRRGEVLQVPQADAASYLKHPMVWVPGEQPWEAPVEDGPVAVADVAAAVAASMDTLVELIEDGDLEGLRQVRPDLADLWEQREAEVRAAAALEAEAVREEIARQQPLGDEEAERLLAHVPGLAKALVQGVSESVFAKLDYVLDLLMVYPPLLEACLETERVGKARKDVLRRLTSMTHDMLRAIEEEDAAAVQESELDPDPIKSTVYPTREDIDAVLAAQASESPPDESPAEAAA